MKRIVPFLAVFFLLAAVNNCAAQNAAAEKILQKALTVEADTNRCKALINAADSFLKKNLNSYGYRAIDEARIYITDNTPVLIKSDFYWVLGELYYKDKKYSAFEATADSLFQLHENGGNQLWQIKALHQKGFAHIHQSKLTEAADLLKQAIAISIEIGNKFYEAKGYQGIGSIAFQGRQIDEVKKQYRRAIDLYQAGKHDVEAALLACSMSRAFVAESKLYIDSAFYWNNYAKPIALAHPDNLELNYFIWQNEADYYARSGDFANAEKAFVKAEEVALKMPSKYSLGGLLQIKSYAAYNAGNYNEAIKLAERSRDVFIEMGDYPMLKKSYQLLYVINEGKGDFENAYESLHEYINISDSIFTQQSMEQINDLNVKYQTAEKEKAIAEKDLAITKKNARLRTLLISLGAALLALLLLAIIYILRRKAYQQSVAALKKEQELLSLKALMAGEEKERNRLAKELHDGLGGILAAAQMQISHTSSAENEKAATLVQKAATETRRIAHNLLPETLLRYGLKKALEEYCLAITESKLLQLEYDTLHLEEPLSQNVELSVYRIIQELINNIIKHAGATEAFIQLHRHNNLLTITVEDNGKGFSATENQNGIGLSNIQSRVSVLNGTMDIKSENQKGTSVYIELTLSKNEHAVA
jgi:signal transduction histidine kinase